MIIQYKNEGKYIPYDINGTKLTLDDELTLNLARYERDADAHIDICCDADGYLVVSAATGARYVAEIDIPARRYTVVTTEFDGDGEGETSSQSTATPFPFDVDTVTLSLWAIE